MKDMSMRYRHLTAILSLCMLFSAACDDAAPVVLGRLVRPAPDAGLRDAHETEEEREHARASEHAEEPEHDEASEAHHD